LWYKAVWWRITITGSKLRQLTSEIISSDQNTLFNPDCAPECATREKETLKEVQSTPFGWQQLAKLQKRMYLMCFAACNTLDQQIELAMLHLITSGNNTARVIFYFSIPNA
jgi:hypothetical protein